MNTLGDRIKFIREKLNLTGEEFGKKLSVTKVAVSNWENNNRRPDPEMLIKIADLGEVTLDYLLKGKNTILEPEAKKTHSSTMKLLQRLVDSGEITDPKNITVKQLNALIEMLQKDALEMLNSDLKK